MPAPQHDEDGPPADAWPSRARQWCRAALALAFVFASLPLASKLLLGNWGFDGAAGIACLCLAAAAYLYFAGRESRPPIPDSATILGEAIRLAASGETDQGIALLDEAFRLSPRLWQAREYRGQMRLGESAAAESALQDFTDAIPLAPAEPTSIRVHEVKIDIIYILKSAVYSILNKGNLLSSDLFTISNLLIQLTAYAAGAARGAK
jgi:tetratricopeptide (TPR) repeat protein